MACEILIVDDEPGIAEGLEYLIRRDIPECHVAGLANDGLDGYEKAIELRPDLVITDIRMPREDGIAMITRLKAAGFQGYFIVLSGYAEFEYAKSAVRLGVEEYIIKPVEEEELAGALHRVCLLIREEEEKREKVEKMRDDLETYSRSMENYRMKEFLNSSETGAEKLRQGMEKMSFPKNCNWYGCALFEENSGTSLTELLEEEKEKELGFCTASMVVACSDRQTAIVTAHGKDIGYRSWNSAVGRLRRRAEERGLCVSVGTSLLHGKAWQLKEAFEEAKCALNYKVLKGRGTQICYEEIRNLKGNHSIIDEKALERLESCIERMDDEGCRRSVDEIFREIEKEKNMNLDDIQAVSLNLLLTGIRKMPFMQLQINEYLGRNILSLESISKFQTIEQLKNWIINTLKGMNELMLKDSIPEKKDVVEEAKAYIRKNFNKEISLNDISEHFFINPYYFSQLFKKKTGQTYQNYVTELRVERAKRLLVETELKIYEVCNMVGYSDTNHFNKVFERLVGMKPSEYRKRGR